MSRTRKELETLVAAVQAEIARLQAENSRLKAENLRLREENASLQGRVEALEREAARSAAPFVGGSARTPRTI